MISTGSILAFDLAVDIGMLFHVCFTVGIGLGFFALLLGWSIGWAVHLIFKVV